jgi:cytochrome b561
MTLLNTPTRYGALGQSLHWLTVVFVCAAYLLSEEGPESQVYAPPRAAALTWHETCGMIVLALVLARLVWRMVDSAPAEPPMPAGMLLTARIVHWALYLLLVAAPVTAITGAWLGGHPVRLMGIAPIGPFFSPSHDLGESLANLHGSLGNAIVWIAGLHAAAALFHHFVLRDRVLVAMLPFRRTEA